MTVSLVEPDEIERVTECITQAFAADPVWSVDGSARIATRATSPRDPSTAAG